MLRLLQTSDLHLGARNVDLGEAAATLRDRRFAAFERSLALAVSEKVDLILIVGDLFDTNAVTKGLVSRVAAALGGPGQAGIRTVILPGDHDRNEPSSVYRAFDLAALAAAPGKVSILDPFAGPGADQAIHDLGLTLTARFPAPNLPDDRWRIGLVHRPVRPRDDEIAGAGVDYLAVGGPHEAGSGSAADVAWGASGSPDPVDVGRDRGGEVLIVRLEEHGERRSVAIERQRVGTTRYEALSLDLGAFADDRALGSAIAARADGGAGADLILDVRLTGTWPDGIEADTEALQAGLRARFLGLRIRNEASPAPSSGELPSAETVGGAYVRDLEARIATPVEGDPPPDELREALRLGRRLLLEPR
ncbi:MAG TPA: metallophosphoesterase [Candidatus Limnocylindrales bacterium]|nr:metallophosphoesterase [Candidatus Limnocylindrales bacterium]